ncbi:MAG: alpha/beta hydrolase [Vicinamibacterales bacterium]
MLVLVATVTGQAGRAAPAPEAQGEVAALAVERAGHEARGGHGVRFTPCPENASLDCGTVAVPIDYGRPDGPWMGIAVIRARTTNPAARIGVLVGNPGGPGVSGVDFVLGIADAPPVAPLRARFDIVSFDPRGVKRSGQVRCDFDRGTFPDASDDAALADYFDELGRRRADACFSQNGPHIGYLGTANVARDLDMIRRALGEARITYAAGSYGSELGATYASLFPERVRAMMLDGGIAPSFVDYNVESWSTYALGFELSFQRLEQVCRRDPACPLSGPGVVPVLDAVLARLRVAPVTGPGGLVLSAARLQDIVAALLGSERNWPLIVRALAAAAVGDDAVLLQLLPLVTGEPLHALLPIWCSDHGTRRPAADILRVDEAVGALTPRFFGRFFVADLVAACSAWPPADSPRIKDVSRRMATPILILANDFDPNTPMIDARAMAQALGMEHSLLRYEGGGHTAFFKGIACIDEAARAYLIDRTLPPPGSSCPAMPVSFGPGASGRTGVSAEPCRWTPASGTPRQCASRVHDAGSREHIVSPWRAHRMFGRCRCRPSRPQ